MISAVTAQGLLRFSTFTGGFTAARFIDFCGKLLADTAGPVYLVVVDGHPAHRAKCVTQFVASTHGRLRLIVLPAYSPQLKPEEWVWKNVNASAWGTPASPGPNNSRSRSSARYMLGKAAMLNGSLQRSTFGHQLCLPQPANPTRTWVRLLGGGALLAGAAVAVASARWSPYQSRTTTVASSRRSPSVARRTAARARGRLRGDAGRGSG
jgi:hypothetical protein